MSTANPASGRRSAFCGIDVGTQGVRAVVVDEYGTELGSGRAPIAHGTRDDVRHEQSPQAWWTALALAVREATDSAGPVVIEAVALDATSGSVLVEAADGSARGPALMYDDARAQPQARRVQDVGSPLWTALGYRMQPSWALPKLLWLVEHEQLRPGDRVVHQADHLVRRLTGQRVPTDVSTALKMGADLRDATWPAGVLAELGVALELLPDLVAPGTLVGTVSGDAASATGLAEGTPVRAGMTDGCAAQIAAGALRPGHWSSALGTTLVVKGSTERLVRDPTGAVYCHRHPDGGWLPGGASSTGAGALDALGPADLAELTEQARPLVPHPGLVYALAGAGERFPFVAPQARAFFEPPPGTPAEHFAGLCQAIAYIERLAYDVLGGLGADVSGPVAFSGATAANVWWNQLRTDVLGRPTLVPRSAQAATGMAVLAAAPTGGLTETAEAMVRIAARYEPDPERSAALRPGYERLVSALVDRGWLDASLVCADREVAT